MKRRGGAGAGAGGRARARARARVGASGRTRLRAGAGAGAEAGAAVGAAVGAGAGARARAKARAGGESSLIRINHSLKNQPLLVSFRNFHSNGLDFFDSIFKAILKGLELGFRVDLVSRVSG